MYNPTFKPPANPPAHQRRSPSPPTAHVEPLSPPLPPFLHPAFSYPALPHDPVFADTPRARASSTSHRSGHKRTPSTIDTLADAALSVSPSYPTPRFSAQAAYPVTHRLSPLHEASEPPHKRARSELLPSPLVGPHASRPVTSYESSNGWHHHQQHHGQHYAHTSYDSRVEEAALLLNFRTGGYPSNNALSPPLPPPPQPAHRPHANSFPCDVYHQRPSEAAIRATLLPPFNPQRSLQCHLQQHPPLPTPQQAAEDAQLTPPVRELEKLTSKVDGRSQGAASFVQVDSTMVSAQQWAPTPPDERTSRTQSTDFLMRDILDVPKENRKGASKGKSRSNGSRKNMTEKAACKRAADRKKIPDASKAANVAGEGSTLCTQRRRSLNDASRTSGQTLVASYTATRARSVPPDVPMFIKEISPPKATRKQAKVTSDTICASCSTARENTTANSEMDEWISCNGCKKWFHIDCAGFKKAHEVRDVDKFFCASCEASYGKTTYVRKSTRAHASVDYAELQKGVLKTSEESVEHHYIQGIKDGTLYPFEPETFPRMRPEMVTREFFEKSGAFVEPICIPAEWNPRPWDERAAKSQDHELPEAAGQESAATIAGLMTDDFEYDTVQDEGQDRLDMVMPEGLTVRQVCDLVGADTPLDVIDVKTQNSGAKWNLGRWADYYEAEGDDKPIRNVISLEVSQSKLGKLLRRPKVVRDIDLQDSVWPQEETDKGKYPKVQYYCLMSVADSYTDFHIDFGGSSVYYHILRGKKTFFFIPPKPKHLKAYEEWNESPQQNYTFLPHITKECYRVDLSAGDTMLIPSGWIHSVWTPATSLVVGGNFLTRMSYRNQFKVVEIEKANHTPMKFRYPFFQKIMWYTVILYLQQDPLPAAVRQLFLDGQQFARVRPVWHDFDGELAASDGRVGAANARYYSQAELDGLPELVNFIFRTVMLVRGLVEGTSADAMKRVNASIPKGHGDPFELAKTFALWVAWKRGNEDPPAWAHPAALLDQHNHNHTHAGRDHEGRAKKLSARAMRDLERKEAIAAWRIAPDRQSERVLAKQQHAATSGTPVVRDSPHLATALHPHPHHPMPSPPPPQAPAHPPAPAVMPSPAFLMHPMPGQHISTPKTSVLGPKRVACDACRKRRIRCKHKDIVVQASFENPVNGMGMSAFQSNLAPELQENITVTPPKSSQPEPATDEQQKQQNGAYALSNGVSSSNGAASLNGHGPLPGTNAYVSANIPMTMNGVPFFGEMPKRGRSKACWECRKSKRRCVHDENGNVDPIKAAETPVPRGSANKRRSLTDDSSPFQVIKKSRPCLMDQAPQPHAVGQAGVLMPQTVAHSPAHQPPMRVQSQQAQSILRQQQTEIDPSLYSYPEPAEQNQYANGSYPYPSTEQSQQTQDPQYNFPSLEQIANEVLDMNGRSHEEKASDVDYIDAQLNAPQAQHNLHQAQGKIQAQARQLTSCTPNGTIKAEGKVDSATSLPNADTTKKRERSVDERLRDALAADNIVVHLTHPQLQPSLDINAQTNGQSMSPPAKSEGSLQPMNGQIPSPPLYRPPAPLSQSPEQTRSQPVSLVNGHSDSIPKPHRDSISKSPSATKKVKLDGRGSREHSPRETADETLARQLAQEELGLRRRRRSSKQA